jgi:hypothetical protein
MDFLNTKKYFLAFWILQHVCKTPKDVGQYSKNIKILFLRNSSLFIINSWIKKISKGLISKILLGIICYYSLLIFG